MKKLTFLIISILISMSIYSQKNMEKETEALVVISTEYGDMTVKLYNETPLHRDNFLKLAKEGFYDGSIFHRIIETFMIQGGGAKQGNKDAGYTVPAEIIPGIIHKKGALSAARQGDHVNPTKASSGSQFYIVQGKTYSEKLVQTISTRNGVKYSKKHTEIYSTLGGTPHLDGDYTVFGEVIEGIEVIDKIAAVKTAAMNKPVEDLKMTVKVIE